MPGGPPLPIGDHSHVAGGFNLKPEVTGHKKAQKAQKEKSGVETVVNYKVKTAANDKLLFLLVLC